MSPPRASTEWDAATYDRTSQPQRSWAGSVIARLADIGEDATLLDVGCGTGLVTEELLALVPRGRVLAIDAAPEMVVLARERLAGRARVWQCDVLELALDEPLDAVFSTACLHWVPDHDRLWPRLAAALRPGGRLEVQCGGEGNIAEVVAVLDDVARDQAPELVGWTPWCFAGPAETTSRLEAAGFTDVRCWLEEKPTDPADLGAFVRTSILPAHLQRLPTERREPFADAVLARLSAPLGYVRLNASATRDA